MLGSAEEAEDVVQQTFAAAYGALLADEREIALKPWLYAIARNGCLSALRVRRDHLALEDGDARLPATVGLSVEVERREDLRALLVDMQRLPEDQRAALILAELGAESHEEIALVLGVPAVKVRALIFQARESLMSRRLAREADCGPIREQLSFLRGGARRRRELRHHLAQCAGCRAFEAETSRQRAGMAVLLPVAPTLALKQSSLAAAFAGGSGAGGAAAGSVAAGGVTAGGVTAGGVTAGSLGGTYGVVGGAVAGGSAAGGAAAGGVASIGGVAVLSGGGVLAGAKLLGLKAMVGLALTGATATGYTAAQRPADDTPAPPAHANASVPSQSKKTAPKPPPAGAAAPIGLEGCRQAGAGAGDCAVKASSDPAPAGVAPSGQAGDRDGDGVPDGQDGDRDGDGVPNGQDGDRDGDGVPNGQDGDRDGDGIPNGKDDDRDGDGVGNGADRCPNSPGTTADGCPVAAIPDPAAATPRDRDGDGVPNGKDDDRDGDGVANGADRCPSKPGSTVDGCDAAPLAPVDMVAKPRDRDGDGVPNRDDADRDGDGVPNGGDKCPSAAGTVDGCPPEPPPAPPLPAASPSRDRDDDGVVNGDDNCPDEPGNAADGCPDVPADATPGDPTPADRDGDGVPNAKDRDRDGDGVLNRDDECPHKPGAVNGCPAAERDAPTVPAVPAPLVP